MKTTTAGRRGGLARAKKLTPEQRQEIARNAVQTRWAKARAAREDEAADKTAHERTTRPKP
jgi:hypothetical protein